MAVVSRVVTLHAAATALSQEDTDYQPGHSMTLRCDAAKVYVGGSDVTPANGFPIDAGDIFISGQAQDTIYACVDPASDGAVANVLFQGV